MIRYFKELLDTLKSIDKSLKAMEKNTADLSACVTNNRRDHGRRRYLATGHWND